MTDSTLGIPFLLLEGFWRKQENELGMPKSFPWPYPTPKHRLWTTAQREAFLYALDHAEGRAHSQLFRGFSVCRLCGKGNGSGEFTLKENGLQWRWPSGYRHYIEEHDVIPTAGFRDWIENLNS